MQANQAAVVMTVMIFIGVIISAQSRKPKAAVSATHLPTSPVPVQQDVHESKYCPFCGTAIKVQGASYCNSCGHKLE